MSLAKAMGPLLDVFKHPYSDLTYLIEQHTGDELVAMFKTKIQTPEDEIKLFAKINDLAVKIQFKLAILNHDWELGLLNATNLDIVRHGVGINLEIHLMFLYCLVIGERFLPVIEENPQTVEAMRRIGLEVLEVANAFDSKLAAGYDYKTSGVKVPKDRLDRVLQSTLPPAMNYSKFNYVQGLAMVTHKQMLDGVGVIPENTNPMISMVNHFADTLSRAFVNMRSNEHMQNQILIYSAVTNIIYAVSHLWDGNAIANLLHIDAGARAQYGDKPFINGVKFQHLRDSNIINNDNSNNYFASPSIS